MQQPAVRAPEFPDSLEWIHTEGRSLTLADLRGKIVVLDFWTYGCINCIHIIPQLRELEMAYANELVVIGVHSGKHTTERMAARIREASLRLGVTHPIVNDRQFRVWRSFAINAWPTVVVIDPRGYVVGQSSGEFTAEQVAPFLEDLILTAVRTETLSHRTIGFAPEESAIRAGRLCYPGKVAVDGQRIAIADTGHHRVLIGQLDAAGTRCTIDQVVGTGMPGFDDGVPGTLNAPQGVTFAGETVYIADTENHAIRAVDLSTGQLRTICGTGEQLRSMRDHTPGKLSSPWDVVAVSDTLYVAMAGTHQLYAIDLTTGAARVHSGNRREDLYDAPHAQAMLAQPMGIAADQECLYFADAESSAIRSADLDSAGAVRTIVGTGLFEFGDRDGVGDGARLQHAQGVAVHASGRLLVADSYNDALKWIDPRTRTVERWIGGFHEPGGVACGTRQAYVADTNAHRICAVDYETGMVTSLLLDVQL